MHRVFTRLTYLSLAVGVALAVFLFAINLPSIRFAMPLWYIAFAALLIGINVALFVFYIRLYRVAPSIRNMTSGMVGSFFALLGFGCISCGSIFFVSLVTAVGGTSLLVILPYLNIGINTLGIGLLILSATFLARTINTPLVCPI